ncbi:MAG: tRNA uridine-5-carboxymethylaminomethyl(34) synthesis GTPase MnmE [Bdellovibrionaceae bacterium]|nr:tRNA uridine-5-carboxymethylaminomethyl(34) synthesis GTPase MnmE [Pseudobdellovibrionaceae bacterium]NUM59551.1 tRNA uridine-5-carboxymethylaminomethyl(34) synthesis GTPase MnmE [Pseudobdellovibrionaceae bacterium]
MFGVRDKDTICSVSTPNGIGGISVIRVSGQQALKIVKISIKNPPKMIESHRVFLANFSNFVTGETIDEVCITPFLDGKSFTGEEVVEISCHGSPTICQLILEQLCEHGARLAEPGEFTYRAFLNSKLDLVQAESVLSVIHSQSKLSAKLGLRQLKGELSKILHEIEDNLLWCLAHIEASIDFSAEDIEIVKDEVLLLKLREVEGVVVRLVDSFKTGKIISDGIQLTLSGLPNVGKSSLMNLFLGTDRSIISAIPGTTRDVVKEQFLYDGIRYIIADTAGIRSETQDVIEKIGIERTLKEQEEAQVNLFLLELFKERSEKTNEMPFNTTQLEILKKLNLDSTFILLNKADLELSTTELSSLRSNWDRAKGRLASLNFSFVDVISFLSTSGIRADSVRVFDFIVNFVDYLLQNKYFQDQFLALKWVFEKVLVCSAADPLSKSVILSAVRSFWLNDQSAIENISVSSSRQYNQLKESMQILSKTIQAIEGGIGHEYIAFDLKEALISIQKIIGVVYDDQILDKVFKEFCLGK